MDFVVNYFFPSKYSNYGEIPNVGQSNFDGRKTLYVLLKYQIMYSKHLDFAKEIYIAIECFQKQFPQNSVGGKCCVSFEFTRAWNRNQTPL